jgi:murein DD-endopeptidase MepM/ murein hydrolase activator NlpD
MINNYGPIPSTYAPPQTNAQPQRNEVSTTSDILSTFKELLSTMMLAGSISTNGQQTSIGAGDLMAPLMLLLLERLVEGQLDKSELSTETSQGTVTNGNITATGNVTSGNVAAGQGAKPVPSGMPVSGGRLTQNYHTSHNGLDIGVVVGTPIRTTMDGTVIHAGWNNQGYGNLVIVENGEYRTYYAHLSSIPVSVGETVRAGNTIGLSGNTGNSTGPHLHYEIRVNKAAINPTSATLGTGA